MMRKNLRVTLPLLALAGALVGFATGVVVSTGPINTPFFLGYGLIKGAYIGTEALASLGAYLSKTATFRWLGALPNDVVLQGLVIGSSLMLGSFIAKRFVLRLPPERFHRLMEAMLLIAGLTMLAAALQ